MPVVLDASAFDVLKEQADNSAGVQLRAWIGDGHGRVAFSRFDEVGRQLQYDAQMYQLVATYHQNGLAVRIADAVVRRETRRLETVETRSGEGDRQVLALAAASKAQVIVARDRRLCKDFEDADLLPELPDSRRRAYPVDYAPKPRNDFLHRRRCPKRLP